MSFKLVTGVFQVKDSISVLGALKLDNIDGPIELLPVAGGAADAKSFGRKSLPHPDLARLNPLKSAAEEVLEALHPTQFARVELYGIDGEAALGVKVSICPTPTGLVAPASPKLAPPIPARPAGPSPSLQLGGSVVKPAKLQLGGFVSKPKQ